MQVVEGRATTGDVDDLLDALGAIAVKHDSIVQAFDARYVVDRAHLERAVELAERERGRGEAIARDPAVELLLYAAGRRQIDQALELGVSEGTCPVVVVAVGGDEEAAAGEIAEFLEPAVTLGSSDEARIREYFDVSDAELAAANGDLSGIVRERVALLVVDR